MKTSKREVLFVSLLIILCFAGGGYFGIKWFPKDKIVEVQIKSPVMDRILNCESSNQQFAADGQLNIHINKDGTHDTGKYMINSIWNKTATGMKLNLAVESDNEAMAYWLYTNVGTGPWYSTQSCWGK